MGNVELFELCDTIPKVQCSDCLLCWNQGVIYCTCGHLLVESEFTLHQKFRMDTGRTKTQCKECLLYWRQGIVCCTCGHLLKESEASQHFHHWRLDAFSIQNYVIKKERPRGARHGKTEAQKEHFIAHNARRRCLKKKIEGIHDRFQRDSTYRDSQLK